MTILRFISVKLSLSLILGILLGHWTAINPITASIFVLVLLASLATLFVRQQERTHPSFGFITGALMVAIGMLSITLANPKFQKKHYSQSNYTKNHTWHLKIREILKSTSFSERYIATIQYMDTLNVSGKVLFSVPISKSPGQFAVDDELLVLNALSPIKPPLNPHQFDYASYMEHLGIYDQVRLGNHYSSLPSSTNSSYGIAATLRSNIISKLKTAEFGNEEIAIIQALLLGQRNDISNETYSNYKNAGAVHILALSGLHIGILLLLLQFLLSPLERIPHGKTVKLISIVILLWSFAFLAGLSASIVRAVAMFSFVAYAQYLNRPTNSFNILALSLFFILLAAPALLFHVGFQMSYAAVFSILWVYPLFLKLWTPKLWILRKGWQLLSVSLAAQMGVLPISLFYFHQFPGLFFVSNLLIIPFLGMLLLLGILIILLAISDILPNFLTSFYNQTIQTMNQLIAWVAKQEAFLFQDISFDTIQLLCTYSIIITGVFLFSKTTFKRMTILCCSIIGMQAWLFFTTSRINTKSTFIVQHHIGKTVIFQQQGKLLNILSTSSLAEKSITGYKIAERIDSVAYSTLSSAYRLENSRLLIIDSTTVYPNSNSSFEYLLLTQSPKINLNRLIDSLSPNIIIADGSNYRSAIKRWKATCSKRKLPFHYTGEKGAYYFNIKD